MEWVETTAKSVDEAKDLALDRLGVDEQDAEFEVLEEPRPGLFGRVRGEARVRARVRPVQPRPKADRRDRRRGGRDAASSSRGGGRSRGRQGAGSAGTDDAAASPAAPEGAPDGGATEAEGSAGAAAPASKATSSEGTTSGRRNRGGRGGRPREGRSTAAAGTTDGEEPTMSDDVTVEQQGAMIQEFVEGLVEAFGYDAEVGTTRIDDETVEVHVDGDDLGLLVGPKGATLQAIHDLSRTVVQRQASGNHEGRVRLDVAGYRERRREALERFTRKVAEQVIASGTAQVLEPMAPADRKIVHDTANDIEGVRTTSEGDEPRRRVVVLPAD